VVPPYRTHHRPARRRRNLQSPQTRRPRVVRLKDPCRRKVFRENGKNGSRNETCSVPPKVALPPRAERQNSPAPLSRHRQIDPSSPTAPEALFALVVVGYDSVMLADPRNPARVTTWPAEW